MEPTTEQVARALAVTPESSAMERAGAMLLGAYIPRTYLESIELSELARAVMATADSMASVRLLVDQPTTAEPDEH